MTINILNLFTADTATKIYNAGLAVANVLGLPVTSWRSGDPTRSLYAYLADVIAAKEEKGVQFAKSGFISTAEGDWATLHAHEVYNVTRGTASYAVPTATLRNAGGGVFDFPPGDLTLKCTATGRTYHNTDNPGQLGPGVTRTYAMIADEAGAASSVGTNEIDGFVTPAELGTFGVVIAGSGPSAAQDEQSLTELRDQCGDTLGALSPNGPPDAYEYVCKNADLTGVTEINRATAIGDNATGLVTVYVASASGDVTAPSVEAAQQAVYRWATPLCINPVVISAAELAVNISAQISGSDIPATFAEAINGRIGALFLALPIGGTIYRSRLISEIHAAVPQIESVNLVSPALDTVLTPDQVPVVGTVSIVEV
jgi:hypothetical protein